MVQRAPALGYGTTSGNKRFSSASEPELEGEISGHHLDDYHRLSGRRYREIPYAGKE